MRVLLKSAIDFNILDKDGRGVIHYCAGDWEDVETLELLLENGFCSTDSDKKGLTIWHIAAASGSTRVLEVLLRQKAIAVRALKMSAKSTGRTPLAEAFACSKRGGVLLLLAHCSRDSQNYQTDVPLVHRAVAMGSWTVYEALIAKHSPTTLTSAGLTPLCFVGAGINLKLLYSLVQKYETHHVSDDGRTALETFLLGVRDYEYRSSPAKSRGSDPVNPRMPSPADYWSRVSDNSSHIIEALLPKSHILAASKNSQHLWEFFCHEVLEDWPLEEWWLPEKVGQRPLPVAILSAFITAGVLHTYECLRDRSALEKLCCSLIRIKKSVFQIPWISTILERTWAVSSKYEGAAESSIVISILKRAIRDEQSDLAEFMVKHGVSVHHKENGTSAMTESCVSGSLESFRQMLRWDTTKNPESIRQCGANLIATLVKSYHDSPIERTTLLKKIKQLLGMGADFDSDLRPYKISPILYAARHSLFDVVDLLLENGADLCARDKYGLDVAKAAAWYGNVDVIRQIHLRGTDPGYAWESRSSLNYDWLGSTNTLENCQILHVAAYRGKIDVIRYLLDEQLIFDVNDRSTDLLTPLHMAVMGGSIEAVQMLTERGADIDAKTRDGILSIDLAFQHDRMDLVRVLIGWNSKPPLQPVWRDLYVLELDSTRSGEQLENTVRAGSAAARLWQFECAILNGELNLCRDMVDKGVSLEDHLPSCHECNPLACAIRACQVEIVKWLLSQGARPGPAYCPTHTAQNFGPVHAIVISRCPSEAILAQLLDNALECNYCWTDEDINPIHLAISTHTQPATQAIVLHISEHADAYQ